MGEPARPRVVMDSLRCWGAVEALAALAALAAGGLPNEKEARDARRWWEEGTEMGEVARSLAMVNIRVELFRLGVRCSVVKSAL